jgi:uncharacterized protein YjiS (DUF1127 family)
MSDRPLMGWWLPSARAEGAADGLRDGWLWFARAVGFAPALPRRAAGGPEAREMPRRAPGPSPRRESWVAALRTAWRRHQTRQHIRELDAHALKDIGVTYADAEAEANKRFWMA